MQFYCIDTSCIAIYCHNRMYGLEQHGIHTYNFESTSQIIELILQYNCIKEESWSVL